MPISLNSTNNILRIPTGEAVTLAGFKGGGFGCPSKERPVTYTFDGFSKPLKIGVIDAKPGEAEVSLEVPRGYEVRQRVQETQTGFVQPALLQRKDDYWRNICWLRMEAASSQAAPQQETGSQIFVYRVEANSLLDIVQTESGTPVATVEVCGVKHVGMEHSSGPVDDPYLLVDVLHPQRI